MLANSTFSVLSPAIGHPGHKEGPLKKRNSARDAVEYFLFRLCVCLIDMLPTWLCVRWARGMAFVVHRIVPRRWTRYSVASENIRTAFGDLPEREVDRMVHEMWVHLFRMVTEIIQLPRKLHLENCRDAIQFRNRNATVRALCTGRPVIVLSGHFGNWEMANVAFGLFGFPMGVVARELDNPYLHRWFQRWRERTGHRLIGKKGGGGEMVQYLDQRGFLALLGDQDAGRKGLFVPFFGKEASTFKSIALLALQHRAIICVGYARRMPDDFRKSSWVQYEIGCEEAIDTDEHTGADAVREITERYTAALERVIRLSPEQYFWVHRRWKSRPRVREKQQRKVA